MAPRPISVRRPYNDANGDGLDDSSGLPRLEHEADDPTSTYEVKLNTGLEIGITDEDGDGRDDTTGLNQAETDAEFERVFGWRQYRDSDGDGLDDVTGENRQDFRKSELSRRSTTDFGSISTSFTDEDGDGRDDTTGWDPDTFSQLRNNANIYRAEAKDAAVTLLERERGQAEREAADQQAAAHDREVEDYRQRYNEYVESGQRTRDLDAGREPMAPPGTPGAPDYAPAGGASGGGGGGGEGGVYTGNETVDRIIGSLTGEDQRAAVALAEAERQRREEKWERLYGYLRSPEEQAVTYGKQTVHEEAPVVTAEADPESIEAQRRALAQYEEIYGSGGMTAADRARLAQGEREMARGMRSQREADLAALRARGLGGSGASIASMLAAQQSGADLLADREAVIQERAEKRAIDALGSGADLAGAMRTSSWNENSWNATQMTDWNKRSADHFRDVEKQNIGAEDKSAESLAAARQKDLENRMEITSGGEGAYQGGSANVRHAQDAEAGAIDRIIGMGGKAVEEIYKGLT